MLRSLMSRAGAETEEEATKATLVLSRLQADVRRDRGASNVHEFEMNLSKLYNTLVHLDNGSVIQINAADGKAFRVALQGMVFVDPSHNRTSVLSRCP